MVQPNVSRWFVPSEYSGKPFQRWGIDPQQITVSGIPIRPKWQAALDRQKIYREWELPAGKKIVLLCGGAEFTAGPVVKAARGIVEACPQACVVVLAGRNKELLAELSGLGYAGRPPPPDRFHRPNARVGRGRLAHGHQARRDHDGGMSGQGPADGLPPPRAGSGRRKRNTSRQGAGVVTRNVDEIIAAVRSLLENPAKLEETSQKAGRLYRPAADIICRKITEILEKA